MVRQEQAQKRLLGSWQYCRYSAVNRLAEGRGRTEQSAGVILALVPYWSSWHSRIRPISQQAL